MTWGEGTRTIARIAVALMICAGAAGCGGDDGESNGTDTTTTTASDQTSEVTEPASDLPEELQAGSGEVAYVFEVWVAWKDVVSDGYMDQDAAFVAAVRGAAAVIDELTPPEGFEQEHATLVADLEGLADAAPVSPDEVAAVSGRVGDAMRTLPCEVGPDWMGTFSSGPDFEDYCDG